jgi:hypothetical protein
MGGMKHYMAMMESVRFMAEDVAAAAKAVKRCSYHEDVLLDQYDPGALDLAYRIANSRVTKGEIELPDGFSRKDFTDMIQKVVKESADECYSCGRMFGDD